MIYVKGTKWEFKKEKNKSYIVKPLTKGEGLRAFVYHPQGTFSCAKLKKNIRKRLARMEESDQQNTNENS